MGEEPPTDTERAIMEATRRAFAEHGYADLSMAKIADEFEKSQSLLHYHYDTKEGLLVAYLRWARRYYERVLAFEGTPTERLEGVVETLLFEGEGLGDRGMVTSFLELHGRAHHSDAVQRELAALDELLRERITDVVEDGIEAGEFADVDPDAVARMVMAAHDSTSVHLAIDDDPTPIRAALESFVLSEVRA